MIGRSCLVQVQQLRVQQGKQEVGKMAQAQPGLDERGQPVAMARALPGQDEPGLHSALEAAHFGVTQSAMTT